VAMDMESGMNFAALAFCCGPPLLFSLVAYYSKSRGVFQWMVTLVFLYFCFVCTFGIDAMYRGAAWNAQQMANSLKHSLRG